MSTENDNHMVWDRHRRGHYEVWYATFNHRASGTGYWIRYTLESPLPGHGEPYLQLWFARFDAADPTRNLALNRKLPLKLLTATRNPFALRLGEASLEHGALSGSLEGDTHQVAWDLRFKPTLFTHRHLPDLVYRTNFADTKVLSPNPIINLHGTVTVDGEMVELEGEPGCQTHLWGRKHAHAWAWSHCNTFREDATACLETLTVRLRRLGLVTPPMTLISLYLGSDVYHLRQFGNVPFNRGSWETGLYRFGGISRRARLEGEFRCRPEDLVQAQYEDPDGEVCFCHNTEVAEAAVSLWVRRSVGSPFKRVAQLTSRGMAHFEYAGRSPDGHVIKRHVTVP